MARSWRDLDECTYYWTLTETKRGSDSASAYWGKYKILSSDHRVLGAETDKKTFYALCVVRTLEKRGIASRDNIVVMKGHFK